MMTHANGGWAQRVLPLRRHLLDLDLNLSLVSGQKIYNSYGESGLNNIRDDMYLVEL